MSVIQVDRLSKTYTYFKKPPGLWASVKSLVHRGKLYTHAVKKISFSIDEGELVGFLGPNGAGKTTTLKMLSGILWPTSGEAKVLGHIPWKRQRAYQKQFALVMGQKNQLWWDLPAMESFMLNKEIYEVPDRDFKNTIGELTELLDIKGLLDVQVRKLSLGERMKAELVAALLHNPKVLLLDEPTIGLDVVSQQKIREFIKKYNTLKRTTILLTSHYMEDVEVLCKRVIIISHGEIIYDGDLASLVNKYADHKIVTLTFLKEVARKDLEALGKIREWTPLRVVFEAPKSATAEIASRALSQFPVDDILIDEVEVEEVIRAIFTRR